MENHLLLQQDIHWIVSPFAKTTYDHNRNLLAWFTIMIKPLSIVTGIPLFFLLLCTTCNPIKWLPAMLCGLYSTHYRDGCREGQGAMTPCWKRLRCRRDKNAPNLGAKKHPLVASWLGATLYASRCPKCHCTPQFAYQWTPGTQALLWMLMAWQATQS